MDEHLDFLEERSRALFHDSVERVGMPIRSRLTQARHAALEASFPARRSWLPRSWWAPAAGVTAAAVLGVALMVGSPMMHHGVSSGDAQSNLEDLDLVAAADGSGDSLEMLQDDIDFYDFADKASNPDPAA